MLQIRLSNRPLVWVAIICATMMCLGVRAYAFDSSFPDLSDTTSSATIRAVNGETQYVRSSNGTIRVWFPRSSGGTITIKNGHFCNGVVGDYIEPADTLTWAGMANGSAVTRFDLQPNGGGTSTTNYGRKYSSGSNCTADIDFTVSDLTKVQNGYYFADLKITYLDRDARGGHYDGVQNYFRIYSSSGSLIGLPGDNDIISPADGNGHQTSQDQAGSSPQHLDYTALFGTDCDIPTNTTQAVLNFYDLDNGGGSGAQLGGKVSIYIDDITTGNLVVLKTTPPTTPAGSFNGAKTKWTPPNTNNASAYLAFTAVKNHKYKLHITNVYYNNTIQYSIPFSQIFVKTCAATPKLEPNASFNPMTSVAPGGTAVAKASVTDTISAAASQYSRKIWYTKADGTIVTPVPIVTNGPVADRPTATPDKKATFVDAYGWDTAHSPWTAPNWSILIPADAISNPAKGYAFVCTTMQLNKPPNPSPVDTIFGSVAHPNPSPPVCIPITDVPPLGGVTTKPYFQVLGGDVNTVTDFCTPIPGPKNATIKAFNLDTPSYGGSGTSTAALSLNPITGFASAMLQPANKPTYLTFANDTGGFGGSALANVTSGCISEDDFSKTPTDSGNTTISGPNRDEWVVSGDVYITANITGPIRKIVATGNIYIDGDVTNIDAILKSKGTVYTCAFGFAAPSPAQIAHDCSANPLTIQGAIIAKDVRLYRTAGDINNSTVAETIIFSPAVWLRDLPGGGGGGGATLHLNNYYDSITTLPPVL